MINKIIKWASWAVSALALLCVFFGTVAYLFGNIRIFGAQYGTYLLFGGYFLLSAILLVLLTLSCKENKKE